MPANDCRSNALPLKLLEDLKIVTVFDAPVIVAEWLGVALDGRLGKAHLLDQLRDGQPLLNAPMLAVDPD